MQEETPKKEVCALAPYQESKLAPAGSLRAALRPFVATTVEVLTDTARRAPELADEVVGLVRALRQYWQARTERLKEE